MTLLKATSLTKKYRNRTVLDCTLELPDNKVIALVGQNGAGKSTLLNIAAGLVTPNGGSLRLLNDLEADSDLARQKIAFVAQDANLFEHLSIKNIVRVAQELNDNFEIALALNRLETQGIDLSRKIRHLSGGQKAQVSLSIALARNPKVLILDEPTASLDPLARYEFLSSLMQAVADKDISVIFSSHAIEELSQVSDHVTLLASGRVTLNQPTNELENQHFIVWAALPDLINAPDIEVIEPDHSAAIGHHMVKVKDINLLSGMDLVHPEFNRIVLGYLRSHRTTETSTGKAS